MVSGITGEAFADIKRYGGSNCKPINLAKYSTQPWTPPEHRYWGGRILNYSSTTLTVVCPVVRDNTTNTNGVRHWALTAKNNQSAKLVCELSSKDSRTGVKLAVGFLRIPYNASSSYGREYGGGGSLPKVSKSRGGSFYELICWIPPYSNSLGASYIQSYSVSEY